MVVWGGRPEQSGPLCRSDGSPLAFAFAEHVGVAASVSQSRGRRRVVSKRHNSQCLAHFLLCKPLQYAAHIKFVTFVPQVRVRLRKNRDRRTQSKRSGRTYLGSALANIFFVRSNADPIDHPCDAFNWASGPMPPTPITAS